VLGELRLKECGYLPVAGTHILSATVSEKVGRWFVSLQVRQEVSIPEPPQSNVIGVDVGIKHLAVTSDGQVFDNPKALTKAQGLLRTRQKAMDRKVKGSANRRKAQEKVAKTHYRIANIRKDAIHKMTSTITKSASVIVVETLNVAGMIKNHHLARALADASLSEIHRQLEYKAKWRGTTLLKADRFYPSSKRCSRCGHKKETLALSERVYRCEIPSCGHVMDRDLNAAINLKNLAGSSPVSACCPGSAGHARKSKTKLLVGQEPEAVGVGL
jgi:putative transposase